MDVFLIEGLDPDSDEGWQCARLHAKGNFFGSTGGMTIFFFIRTIAVPVFKIDPEILDRLGFDFSGHPVVNPLPQVMSKKIAIDPKSPG